jgi:Excalibur calcium-binding domain
MFRLFIASAIVCAAAGMGAATASAQSPYPNCKAAAADGVYDIPSDSPYYGPWLDRDQDGVGCES